MCVCVCEKTVFFVRRKRVVLTIIIIIRIARKSHRIQTDGEKDGLRSTNDDDNGRIVTRQVYNNIRV